MNETITPRRVSTFAGLRMGLEKDEPSNAAAKLMVSKVRPRPRDTAIGSPRLPRKRYKACTGSPPRSPNIKTINRRFPLDTPVELSCIKEVKTPTKFTTSFIRQEVCVASTPAHIATGKLATEDSQLYLEQVPPLAVNQLKTNPPPRPRRPRPRQKRQPLHHRQSPPQWPVPFLPSVTILGDFHVSRLAPRLQQWTGCYLQWFCKNDATIFDYPIPRGKADVVVVHLGGNDLADKFSPYVPDQLALAYFSRFCDLGNIVVFIGAMLRRRYGHIDCDPYHERVWQFNNRLHWLCEGGHHTFFFNTGDIDLYVDHDGVHLNRWGLENFHRLLQRAVHQSLLWLRS